jgi:CRISPR-associated protein Cas1
VVTQLTGVRSRVPINAVDGIVLTGRGQPSAELLTECARRSIRVAALSGTGRLRFAVSGPIGGNVHLRVAQHRAAGAADTNAMLARSFVAGKLQNSRRMLLRWSRSARTDRARLIDRLRVVVEERLQALRDTEDGDRIRGLEGDAARRYFRGLALHLGGIGTDFTFTGRSRRPPRDPLNAALSYTYGLVLAELVGALDAVGLDPQIGFLHGLRSGRPSLALDVLEEFRPAVADRFVVRTIARRQLAAVHFTFSPGGACYLTEDGRRALLDCYEVFKTEEVRHILLDRVVPRASLPGIQATLLARTIRGDLSTYPPFIGES